MKKQSSIKLVPHEEGVLRPKYMIIGEAPGAEEEKQGRPFVGRSGKFLRAALQAQGINLDECYYTNVVKVRPPNNRVPSHDEVVSWMPMLMEEIFAHGYDDVKIFSFGGTAQSAVKMIEKKFPDLAIWHNHYGFYHPSYIQRFRKGKAEWLKNIKEAIDAPAVSDQLPKR